MMLVGDSPHLKCVLATCALYGPRERNVAIVGETGTGKSLVAAELVRQSPRAQRQFARLAAGELDLNLARTMLAGHRRGSFTGAVSDSLGLLRATEGGTVFLDDVQDLPLAVQPYLLDAIEKKPMRSVGETREFIPNVRWVFGSQRPLSELVAAGLLKRDLAARMGVASITLLPLREHVEDVVQLVPHLLERIARVESLTPLAVSAGAFAALQRYSWPDNVRELEDALSIALIEASVEEATVIEVRHLPSPLRHAATTQPRRRRVSKEEIQDALEAGAYVVSHVARKLGVNRRTVQRCMRELQIERPGDKRTTTERHAVG